MKKNQLSGLAVVIPARNEPEGQLAIQTLIDFNFTSVKIEIYVVINSSSSDDEVIFSNNRKLYDLLNLLQADLPDNYQLHILMEEKIPDKIAGVGYARKVGMDLAALHFQNSGIKGVIVCFDADSFAPSGYLQQIFLVFNESDIDLASIQYRHILTENSWAIVSYEAMLRYYSLSLRKANYPYWHQTIGSSMAVTSDVYLKQGGMNTRKAGEDFYFMHKFMPVCRTTTIVETCNQLSARTSDRVPFGTGKAMLESERHKIQRCYTYHPTIFKELKAFIQQFHTTSPEEFMKGKTWVHDFFSIQNYWADFLKIQKNSKNRAQFVSSFFRYFNGFRVLKYVHWCRDVHVSNISVIEALHSILPEASELDGATLLNKLREMEKEESLNDRW